MAPASPRVPADHLPLSAAMFHVLVAIADEPRHGYVIIKDVSSRTDGTVELGTGTLYGIVKRLLADGLAEESNRRGPAHADDPRRRYYKLTAFGRQVVAAETERLESMVAAARATRMLRKGAR